MVDAVTTRCDQYRLHLVYLPLEDMPRYVDDPYRFRSPLGHGCVVFGFAIVSGDGMSC